jgi:hypothetical protein
VDVVNVVRRWQKRTGAGDDEGHGSHVRARRALRRSSGAMSRYRSVVARERWPSPG